MPFVIISGVAGMTEVNGVTYKVAGKTTNTFQLNDVDNYILIIALKSCVFQIVTDADDYWKSRLICDDDYEY